MKPICFTILLKVCVWTKEIITSFPLVINLYLQDCLTTPLLQSYEGEEKQVMIKDQRTNDQRSKNAHKPRTCTMPAYLVSISLSRFSTLWRMVGIGSVIMAIRLGIDEPGVTRPWFSVRHVTSSMETN